MGRIRQVGVVGGVLVALLAAGVLTGVLGAPSVTAVENRFAGVSEERTTIETDLVVSNPNPIGVQLGGVSVDYTVRMNTVPIASGGREGLQLSSGESTLGFTTEMDNEQIPAWWHTHVENGERTQVEIDADVRSSTLGRSLSVTQGRSIETDIIGQFNSTETRPVDANAPLVSDPVLYINETRGAWDRPNLTRQRTPMELAFTVHNPKPIPYTVSRIGYTVSMNDVEVGAGETTAGAVISPGETETIDARAAIENDNLDDWWVTHLQRNQRTQLRIDFYLVVEGGGTQLRIPLDPVDYEKTIETDIFGNKDQYPTGTGSSGSDKSAVSEPTATPTTTPDDGVLDTATASGTDSDGGDTVLGTDGAATSTPTATATRSDDDQQPTETPTDDGLLAL
ncbi:LEA type 2 family protein [Halomicroarcula sp. GCM10025709]|uniref:LEA type 2 family protein n=1 Tax=Haloarcula TaxID=2237 RepID=UPI0024C2E234|nr:LEA type 2 family protein [Halomicroarcula sp. YJ-61-S]